ncbi:HD domain-containing protein [Hespellia stercorisuis]|uniref:HDIG domain-containing protein n=1 Tax=Hespellia stercorisuis DSM 15480 TaxID=1121950 RepID=A0A1M6WGZ9_9FIRM|nr:HD domain-containing protein [Hespellia stercorisuis]SHK93052.1 HDIG domain-containing protein [Hespellia stercorisuis DSM 15480]
MNRQTVTEVFQSYVENYDLEGTKIKIKVNHTYRVAGLSEVIAQSLQLEQEDVDLAWLIGMLHDIGRFEQLRRFDTFHDAESVDHAKLAVKILFEDGLIRHFLSEVKYDAIIQDAVQYHSAYRIPEEMDARTRQFCDIIRDADKVDIFRVNAETPLEEIYNIPAEEFYTSTITPEVLEAYEQGDTVLRSLKKTAMDYVVGHISLRNGLVYQKSRELVSEQGYLQKMLDFPTRNPETKKQLEQIRQQIH